MYCSFHVFADPCPLWKLGQKRDEVFHRPLSCSGSVDWRHDMAVAVGDAQDRRRRHDGPAGSGHLIGEYPHRGNPACPCDGRNSRGRLYGYQRRFPLLGRTGQKIADPVRSAYRCFLSHFTDDPGCVLGKCSGGCCRERRQSIFWRVCIGVCAGEGLERTGGSTL